MIDVLKTHVIFLSIFSCTITRNVNNVQVSVYGQVMLHEMHVLVECKEAEYHF